MLSCSQFLNVVKWLRALLAEVSQRGYPVDDTVVDKILHQPVAFEEEDYDRIMGAFNDFKELEARMLNKCLGYLKRDGKLMRYFVDFCKYYIYGILKST